MSEIGEYISRRIRRERISKRISQKTTAAALEVPLRTYQAWEKDFTSSVENLLKICNFFQLSPCSLLQSYSDYKEESVSSLYKNPDNITVIEYKKDILERALAGESSSEIFHWMKSTYPEIVEGISSEEKFIENCLLDIYHLQYSLMFQKSFERIKEKERAIEKLFGIPEDQVIIVNSGNVKQQFLREVILSRYGAEWIIKWAGMKPGFRLGISNGFTVSRILDAIPRGSIRDMSLFPLNFTNTQVDFPISSTALISSFLYKNTGYNISTDTLTEEQVFGAILLADAALLGIGSFSKEGLYERMICFVLGHRVVSEIRKLGVVGDLNYYLLDKDGNQINLPEIISNIGSENSSSLVKAVELSTLREKAERGCRIVIAASGKHKAEIVRIALKKGYANHIITDETIADVILQ